MHIKPHKEPCKGANPQCTSSLVVVRQDAVPSGGNGFYQGAWVTQPSWLHQFRFGWTSAHPITKPGAVTKVESHFFFGPPPTLSRDFFFHLRTSPAHPTTLFKKQIPTYPTPLLMLWIYFFKALFHFVVIVNAATMYSPLVIADVQRRTRNCHNFKVWATRGAIFSRRHLNKICFLQFFLHLWFLYIFNLGLSLWDLLF